MTAKCNAKLHVYSFGRGNRRSANLLWVSAFENLLLADGPKWAYLPRLTRAAIG